MNLQNNRIVQTPSHLFLFDKGKVDNKINDYRDSMSRACKINELIKQFYNPKNVNYLSGEIAKRILKNNNYEISVNLNEIVTAEMSNAYRESGKDISSLEQLNRLVLERSNLIYKHLISHDKFIKDQNSIHTLMNPPKMTSNKINKQLPKQRFI